MKKLLFGTILLVFVVAVPIPTMAQVNINIQFPLPPPIVFDQSFPDCPHWNIDSNAEFVKLIYLIGGSIFWPEPGLGQKGRSGVHIVASPRRDPSNNIAQGSWHLQTRSDSVHEGNQQDTKCSHSSTRRTYSRFWSVARCFRCHHRFRGKIRNQRDHNR